MSLDEEYPELPFFDNICPNCGVGNPENADNCLVCDNDLTKTVLFLEDEFYDLEITTDTIIEYRKNFYRTRRTGKIKKYSLDKVEKIEFGHPITRFIFEYRGEKIVYALKKENYDLLRGTMVKIGKISSK